MRLVLASSTLLLMACHSSALPRARGPIVETDAASAPTEQVAPGPGEEPAAAPGPSTVAVGPSFVLTTPTTAASRSDVVEESCTPASHPLATALSRDLKTTFEAMSCVTIRYPAGARERELALPGIVIERVDQGATAPEGRFDLAITAWPILEKYRAELGFSSPVREALRWDGDRRVFVQRIAGSGIDAEGVIGFESRGETITKIRLSTMPLPAGAKIPSWKALKPQAMAAAARRGLLFPRLRRLPTSVVTRDHGVVFEFELSGIEINGVETRQTDTLVVRVAAAGSVLEERTVAVERPRPVPDLMR